MRDHRNVTLPKRRNIVFEKRGKKSFFILSIFNTGCSKDIAHFEGFHLLHFPYNSRGQIFILAYLATTFLLRQNQMLALHVKHKYVKYGKNNWIPYICKIISSFLPCHYTDHLPSPIRIPPRNHKKA